MPANLADLALDLTRDYPRSPRALFAGYPELAYGDVFVEELEVTTRQCLAVALLTDLETLADSIAHYRAHLINLENASTARTNDNDF